MKTLRYPILVVLCLYIFQHLTLNAQVQSGEIKIGIISDYESARLMYSSVIMADIKTLVDAKYNVQFPDDKNVDGGYSYNLLKQLVQDFLADDDLDIIIGVGAMVSEILARSGPYPIPVIANGVFHPGHQNIPITASNTSGLENFGYLIYEDYPNSIPGFSDFFFSYMTSYDANAQIIPMGKDYRQVLDNLPSELDALYICIFQRNWFFISSSRLTNTI